jgi:hypothetical protein
MIVLIDAEKIVDKTLQPFIIKTLKKLKIEKMYPNIIKTFFINI